MRYDGARLADFSVAADDGKGRMDLSFLPLVQGLGLLGTSVLMVLSSGFPRACYDPGRVTGGNAVYYFVCQLLFAGLGVGVMLLASRLPMGFYRRYTFPFLILRGYWIALHCRSRFSFLVCAGITTLLAVQVFFNVAVATNLLPCTGSSLPFFSYGGTALLIQRGGMGIVLSASRDILEI